MRRSALLSAALLLLLESAVATSNVVVESLHAVPEGWRKLREADPTRYIRLRIALEQPNLAQFEKVFYDISTPKHSRYGQHLSRDELREMMKPREESTNTVIAWLRASGIPPSDIENDGEWINVLTTVGNAEQLLDAEFGVYSHVGTQAERLRTLQYVSSTRFCKAVCSPEQVFGAGGCQVPYHHDPAHHCLWDVEPSSSAGVQCARVAPKAGPIRQFGDQPQQLESLQCGHDPGVYKSTIRHWELHSRPNCQDHLWSQRLSRGETRRPSSQLCVTD